MIVRSRPLARVKLGCPKYCPGYTCVDLYPIDDRVIRQEALDFLSAHRAELDHIYSKNMLEHVGNPLELLKRAYLSLKPGGELTIITDNAEWLPFYLPFPLVHTGIGAHGARQQEYLRHFGDRTTHYMIFTKAHLKSLLTAAGFRHITVRRMWRYAFARLYAQAIK